MTMNERALVRLRASRQPFGHVPTRHRVRARPCRRRGSETVVWVTIMIIRRAITDVVTPFVLLGLCAGSLLRFCLLIASAVTP